MTSQLPLLLQKANKINQEQALHVLKTMSERKTDAYTALLSLEQLSPKKLTTILSELFNLPIIKLDSYDYFLCCQHLGLGDLVRRHSALPITIDNEQLTLAVIDPSIAEPEQDFRFATGMKINLVLCDARTITHAIHNLYGDTESEKWNDFKELTPQQLEQLVELPAEETVDHEALYQDTSPISRYIHQVLLDAIRKRASDIHFEPYKDWFRIRFRCDGLLIEMQQPPNHLSHRLTARLKILAKLDVSERRLPQDGRITLAVSPSKNIDIRVSTLPTIWGEKAVLRLLDKRITSLQLDHLGYNPSQSACYRHALAKPQGMILITGPTGCGKTLSLYSGLNILNQKDINIATAEDPVEIHLSGINQVQIQPKIGFGFAQALRAFLRQDPDVVMVGEIRDYETADIATKASQTGHLVLSTLHTNSASEAVLRMQNMGVKPFNIAAALSLIIAQRLVRRLCPQCKRASLTSIASQDQVFEANPEGCHYCNQGYAGRIGLFEILPVTPQMAEMIAAGATPHQIEKLAMKQGMQTLQQSGLEKLTQGLTSQTELQRVLPEL
ncbi:type IV-A pilus assembly ATPase PilB [Vibrio sp. T11.5]|uniref:type IV-A pilus assembly ATPase PilB n=1 Tax=Vibrio sp. T11.5 TaxID=2998836 RepID=UPI0022CD40B8|nr:type IV-A pilus assembly ATPase PilB [Vibrio sp. T11.5]MDA0117260.1 type IV-A pilus assembly ATPase PilB [Vibrio sp. T11.5]